MMNIVHKKYCLILWLWAAPLAILFAQSRHAKPFQLGMVEELHSAILHETRVLNIYLPEGYSPDSAALYPVIYLLDGSADEDFIHVSGLVQFCNFPWIEVLPKSIVVGIANVDRKRDFTFPTSIADDKKTFPTTGGSEAFISFLEKELQPYVQQHYKVSTDKMLIGQSLGGLLATEILFKKPGLFNQYVIVSPSLWWDKESLLRIQKQPITQPTRVFVAVGKEGRIMERDAKKLYRYLKNTSSPMLSPRFEFLKNKNHATIFHQAVFDAFEQLKKMKK
jgi:hypothetical protein